MASSSFSSAPPPTWRYKVFTSFHGPDVRKTFLSHLRKQFNVNGISMFDDQGIERGQTIAPALRQAIRDSRISIVVLSKNYASSSWCLDELLEIFKCKETRGQIVMTVFYGVDPSDVRNQAGDFGIAFTATCAKKTEELKRKWSQGLKDAGNIAGEHFLNWEKESEMIEKIARDVSNKLNVAVSWDFEDMVGIEAHLQKMLSLLHLDNEDESMIVGICGPAGIGKTTIARALHSRLSSSFQLTCFMEDIKGSYNSRIDDYGSKLFLQKQLLSKISNQDDIRITHLGAISDRLCDQKVLIILDDVDDMKQLEALANKPYWFGPGSRIIVTTEDQKLLEQHHINHTYHVDFPTKEEAHKILCSYAFRSSLAPYGFEKLVERVTTLCSNLPLGLSVMGSSLLGMGEDDWESILHRLENSLDPKINGVLRVGYEKLDKVDQDLFLLIAFFFNYEDEDHVKTMLGNSNLDVSFGLKNLKSKSLIQKSTKGEIVMHKLLQQVGREENQRQDRGKRQILTDPDEICDVLENKSDSRRVMGISFDISTLQEDLHLSARALTKMRTLRFLKIYKSRRDTNYRVHIPEDMDFPFGLKLLDWSEYPEKCLPHKFKLESLVELNLSFNKLEKLWEGSQPLANLKKMNLNASIFLKELPDLSVATNLERLYLGNCYDLVEIPSYIGSLHKLEVLEMAYCINLQVLPTHFNLASLNMIDMRGCWQLRKLPDISTNIGRLEVSDTMLEELLGSVTFWSHLKVLHIWGSVNPIPIPQPDMGEIYQMLRGPDIEKIPDCIKDLHGLKYLEIYGCPKLASLPEFPRSLHTLIVSTCESLETLMSFPSDSQIENLYFTNCFKLGEEARRVITHQSERACLPGRNIPAEFNHRAIGNSLTIPLCIKDLRICVVISPKQKMVKDVAALSCRLSLFGIVTKEKQLNEISNVKTEHLYIYHFETPSPMVEGETLWEFSSSSEDIEIIECGYQILKDQTDGSRSSHVVNEVFNEVDSDELATYLQQLVERANANKLKTGVLTSGRCGKKWAADDVASEGAEVEKKKGKKKQMADKEVKDSSERVRIEVSNSGHIADQQGVAEADLLEGRDEDVDALVLALLMASVSINEKARQGGSVPVSDRDVDALAMDFGFPGEAPLSRDDARCAEPLCSVKEFLEPVPPVESLQDSEFYDGIAQLRMRTQGVENRMIHWYEEEVMRLRAENEELKAEREAFEERMKADVAEVEAKREAELKEERETVKTRINAATAEVEAEGRAELERAREALWTAQEEAQKEKSIGRRAVEEVLGLCNEVGRYAARYDEVVKEKKELEEQLKAEAGSHQKFYEEVSQRNAEMDAHLQGLHVKLREYKKGQKVAEDARLVLQGTRSAIEFLGYIQKKYQVEVPWACWDELREDEREQAEEVKNMEVPNFEESDLEPTVLGWEGMSRGSSMPEAKSPLVGSGPAGPSEDAGPVEAGVGWSSKMLDAREPSAGVLPSLELVEHVDS